MNLDVLIPSLFLPASLQKLIPPPNVPALERLLARATPQTETATTGMQWLCERWDMKAPYPVAPLFAEQDGLAASGAGWMFAEPVQLIPDRDRLKLFPAHTLALHAHEAAELIATLNTHFSDRQLQFFAPAPERWYVSCAPSEIPRTTPPNATHGDSLTDFQPKSTGKLDWRSLQNEAQMLLFGHRVNEAREASGKPAVSGVWFWGGGVSPELQKPTYDCVVANPGLAEQLATKSGIETRALSLDAVASAKGNVLVAIDSRTFVTNDHELSAWSGELERLDREWFQPISQALRNGVVQQLNLYAPDPECARRFSLTPRDHLLKFWRSTKPLSTYA